MNAVVCRVLVAVAAGLVVAGGAVAQPHGGDVALAVDGRILTGTDGASGFAPQRVFEGEFGVLGENITDEPGYDCEAGTFPAGSAVGFRILRAVREWDGAAFAAIPDERIAVTRSTFPAPPPVFSPLMDDPMTGFTVAVGADGRWHVHLEYNLLAPAEPGAYLLELELFSTAPGIEPSRPFWLVLAKGTDEEVHGAAVAWTEYVLARQGCVADFDRDRAVNSSDISAFLTRWLTELGTGADQADVHPDLVINSVDIARFLEAWIAAVQNGC